MIECLWLNFEDWSWSPFWVWSALCLCWFSGLFSLVTVWRCSFSAKLLLSSRAITEVNWSQRLDFGDYCFEFGSREWFGGWFCYQRLRRSPSQIINLLLSEL